MRKFLLLAAIVLLGLVVWNRQRLYLRDPLATVYRGDVVDQGARVYINYSNDVLVENDGYRYVVQNWNKSVGVPGALVCEWHMGCLLDNDHAALVSVVGTGATMSSKSASFAADGGGNFRIDLH